MTKIFLTALATLLLMNCSHTAVLRKPDALPDSRALKAWKESSDHPLGETNLDSFQHLEFDCSDKNLYPTHPQENLKVFHRFNTADYDKKKLEALDEACLLSSKAKTNTKAKTKKNKDSAKLTCLRANVAVDVVMSDTYEDSCGHRYRAFWQLEYLKNQQTPQTLVSKGRTALPTSEESPDLTAAGATKAVPVSDFLFLSPLFPEDQEKIEQKLAP